MGWAREHLGAARYAQIARELFRVTREERGELVGICPLHDDRNASLSYNPDKGSVALLWLRPGQRRGDLVDLFAAVHGHELLLVNYAKQRCAEVPDDNGLWRQLNNQPNHYPDCEVPNLVCAHLLERRFLDPDPATEPGQRPGKEYYMLDKQIRNGMKEITAPVGRSEATLLDIKRRYPSMPMRKIARRSDAGERLIWAC